MITTPLSVIEILEFDSRGNQIRNSVVIPSPPLQRFLQLCCPGAKPCRLAPSLVHASAFYACIVYVMKNLFDFFDYYVLAVLWSQFWPEHRRLLFRRLKSYSVLLPMMTSIWCLLFAAGMFNQKQNMKNVTRCASASSANLLHR